jgi:hypothetical protein
MQEGKSMNAQQRAVVQQALEVLKRCQMNEAYRDFEQESHTITALRQLLEPEPVQEHELALYEATQIATWLWKNFYKDTAPQWEVLPDIRGVLSQIDNMVAGLKYDPPAQPAAWVGLTPEQVRACFFAGEPPASSPPHWWEYRNPDYMAIYNNIEQRLKEKNT